MRRNRKLLILVTSSGKTGWKRGSYGSIQSWTKEKGETKMQVGKDCQRDLKYNGSNRKDGNTKRQVLSSYT